MELIILGSGTSVPHSRRTSSSYWIETESSKILIDCSASSIHRMAQEGCAWDEIDAIWISHFHLDHSGGLGPLLFGSKWAPSTQGREKPLRIIGGVGIKDWFSKIDEAYGYELLEQPYPVKIIEVEPLESFEVSEDIEGVSFDTPHTDESRAIHLKDREGKTFVFSADTGFTESLGAFAKDVDVFLLECSFIKDKPVESHIQLNEAIHLARYSKAKKTVLTHLYPEWDSVDFETEIAKFNPGVDIVEAVDGLRIEV